MRALWLAITGLLLCAASVAAELGTARLSLVSGDVQIYTGDSEEWVAATVNLPLAEQDRLWVPASARSELHLRGQGYLRLDGASSLDLLALGPEAFRFQLNSGRLYVLQRREEGVAIRIETPLATIDCTPQSRVMIDVTENGPTRVAVLKGSVVVDSDRGQTRVVGGSTLRIAVGQGTEIAPLAPPDDWEDWNRARDKELAAGEVSRRYLPEELNDYAVELDAYGSWVEVGDYGYCWRPLAVERDWSPYRYGRWYWRGGDYVWIAYEPWGWGPHHYGRWFFDVGFGWCWAPPGRGAVQWGPGFVGWVHTPALIAWVPLAPGEIYHGRRDHGAGHRPYPGGPSRPHFRNSGARNGIAAVGHDDFRRGRHEPRSVQGNPFREPGGVFEPPAIEPGRELRRPVEREVPVTSQPPPRLRRPGAEPPRTERLRESPEDRSGREPARVRERPGDLPPQPKAEPQRLRRDQLAPEQPASKNERKPSTFDKPGAKKPPVTIAPSGRKTTPPAAPGEKNRRDQLSPTDKSLPSGQTPAGTRPELPKSREGRRDIHPPEAGQAPVGGQPGGRVMEEPRQSRERQEAPEQPDRADRGDRPDRQERPR